MISTPLWWRKGPRGTQVADVLAGCYKLMRYPGGWSAFWFPRKGRSKTLRCSLPEADAKEACEADRLERVADGMLKSSGASGLAKSEFKGPAAAYRKGRGHG